MIHQRLRVCSLCIFSAITESGAMAQSRSHASLQRNMPWACTAGMYVHPITSLCCHLDSLVLGFSIKIAIHFPSAVRCVLSYISMFPERYIRAFGRYVAVTNRCVTTSLIASRGPGLSMPPSFHPLPADVEPSAADIIQDVTERLAVHDANGAG